MDAQNQGYVIRCEINSFLIDRRSRQLSRSTIAFYQSELRIFATWADDENLKVVQDVTPTALRSYLLYLEEQRHRNRGGVHAGWRVLKVFLRWFEDEYNPPDWINPIRKVQPPQRSHRLITGVGLTNVRRLLATCDDSLGGRRDAAIFLTLTDTGLRIGELTALNIEDLDMRSGTITVQHGKGDKARLVFVSPKTLKALVRYLRMRGRPEPGEPLFAALKSGGRITRGGEEYILRAHEVAADIHVGGWHNFRRTYALEMLRDGTDVVTLSRLLGHSDTSLVMTYAKQTQIDLRNAAEAHSPVERM